jgi:HEAT repeat protein
MRQASILDELMAAAAAGDDERAEALVAQLAPGDEPALLALATASDPDQRWWAMRALAEYGSAAAAGVIAAALHDADPSVRAAAALTLAKLQHRRPEAATPYLAALAALLADDQGLVRQAAADALSQCGDAAVAVLANVLREDAEAMRSRAAYALRKIGTYRAAAVLYPLLEDPNPLVRAYAYEGLDDLGLLENLLLAP